MFHVKSYAAKEQGEPMEPYMITRRDILPTDIEIEILYCGICHSDLHTIKNDWGNTTFPVVPGHEIIGKVIHVWDNVTKFSVGDLTGIWCIVDSCWSCTHCSEWEEQFCDKLMFSFNASDWHTWWTTYGWFSEKYVCDEKYVVKMPPFEDLAAAAPLLCAGITVYSPLKYWGAWPHKNVWIIGVWWLWHIAIKIAKKMGAEVTVFTTSPEKIVDAKKLWADHVILSTASNQMESLSKTIDFIIDTVSFKHDINMYMQTLKPNGTLILVWLPNQPLEISAFSVVSWRKSFSWSNIGGINETQEMLDFCFKHNITADIELIDISTINKAMDRLEKTI